MVWGKGDNMRLRNQQMKYNLQIFAEGGSNGADGGNGAEPGAEGGESTQVQATLSFDDFLKDGKNQSEFDKRVAKAIETSRSKWQAEYESKLEAEKTEAAKFAKMNAEQKAQYEAEKRAADLDERERAITERELKAQANVTLTEKGLPLELSKILKYKDAETCNSSIEVVEKAFQAALEKAVNDKLRGSGAPKVTKSNNVDSYTEALRKSAGL